MSLKQTTLNSESKLIEHIKTHQATFYTSSKTSTVIPYEKIEQYLGDDSLTIADLSLIPPTMHLNDDNNLIIRGAVSWKDAREFLRSKKLNIMTSPTEELALILAGVATSCTGERCFSFGNLRSQIVSLKYLNYDGEEISLDANKDIKTSINYQKDFEKYKTFKNAPFPRLLKETDLMVGTEGQLGVITEVELKTVEDYPLQHLFLLLPKWEDNLDQHLDVLNKIQNFRDDVLLCEFVDSNSFRYLKEDERPNKGMDAIFFEIKKDKFDDFYNDFLMNLDNLNEELVFELSEAKFHNLRASIPRAVFEANSQMGVVKMGTDIQVKTEDFKDLMELYQALAKEGVDYNLFGHFGDSHLHFNFMPTPTLVPKCQLLLEGLYKDSIQLNASPFAEHGIGIIKQKYIKDFWSPSQYKEFKELKELHDPHNQFFPKGYMSIKQ